MPVRVTEDNHPKRPPFHEFYKMLFCAKGGRLAGYIFIKTRALYVWLSRQAYFLQKLLGIYPRNLAILTLVGIP